MNILLISREFPPARHGGMGSFNAELADSLIKHGHQAIVLTEDDICHDSLLRGYPLIRIKNNIRAFSKYWAPINWYLYSKKIARELPKIVKRYDIDLIEASSYGCETFAYTRQPAKIPVILRMHGLVAKRPIDPELRLTIENLEQHPNRLLRTAQRIYHYYTFSALWQLEQANLKAADHLIAPSHFMAGFVNNLIPSTANKTTVIENGVNTQHKCKLSNKECWDWYCSDLTGHRDDKIILFVGRISTLKGADLLAKVIPQVLREVPKARFVFAGRVIQQEIVGHIQESTLIDSNRVIFLDHISRQFLERLYNICQISTLPTLYEVSSMATFEAMNYGKPTISTNTGPLPEIVIHGKTGLLIPPRDTQALFEAIISLLKDDRVRLEMGAQAKAFLEEQYDIEHCTKKTITLYEKVISNVKL